MIGVEIKGTEALAKTLKKIGGVLAIRAAQKEIEVGALLVQGTAINSISREISQGRVYGNHTASKRGDPPNTDTGRLVQSIQVEVGDLSAIVGTNLKYGKWLEYGTEHIAPRPWLRPALQKNEKDIAKAVAKAVLKAIK